MVVTIKVRDVQKSKESELTIIDIIGFDQKFTERIMNGQTDIEITEENQDDYGKVTNIIV